MNRAPLRLQTRLMAAVIGIVSLILVVVAVVTSATLGRVLEESLDRQLHSATAGAAYWTNVATISAAHDAGDQAVSATRVLAGKSVAPGLLLVITAPDAAQSGAIVQAKSDSIGQIEVLEETQLQALASVPREVTTITVPSYGSYRVMTAETMTGTITVGLPRADNQRVLRDLFTTIVLATLGGLLLLALTTALSIRITLRPLRAVAETATRVAAQPLDQGAVSITERVPAEQADARTETGAVGAALNTLLDHVDASLASRQRKEQQMRRFVADASHELRTPLASIRGYSELSLRALDQPDAAAPDTRTALERIQAQSLRMTRLVEDLLLLARLDEGQELLFGTVDLTQLALEELADARLAAPEHDWQLDVPAEPVIVTGDAGRLQQVIANLLANAQTHTPAGTTIRLSVSAEPDVGVLRVQDNGPGIDPGLIENLFARFARGDASRARQTGGTGLGLAIAKAIVDGHSGSIEVDSSPGTTTFTVRLPRAAAATQ